MIEARADIGWKQLIERLREFVGRRVPESDAEDVLQDSLVRILRGLQGLRDDEGFGPWVYRVTRSAIADHLRARSRPLEAGGAPADEDLAAPAAEQGDDLGPALLRCLSGFVAELPSPYREAITLTELEGLSQREAAETLGLSLSGMKSRVQRGRERLREVFERCCKVTLDTGGRVIALEPRAGGGTSAPADTGRRACDAGCDAHGAGRESC
jgi:RNA polymerase sigma-70 factor, ECF subfamily